jgi:hypothetical protein
LDVETCDFGGPSPLRQIFGRPQIWRAGIATSEARRRLAESETPTSPYPSRRFKKSQHWTKDSRKVYGINSWMSTPSTNDTRQRNAACHCRDTIDVVLFAIMIMIVALSSSS